MDRTVLLATLETANRHIAEGERHIERQREIVARFDQRGRGASHTATVARELSHSMERVQCAHLSHRGQLKAELSRLDAVEPLPSLINVTTDAECGRDTHIAVQEGS